MPSHAFQSFQPPILDEGNSITSTFPKQVFKDLVDEEFCCYNNNQASDIEFVNQLNDNINSYHSINENLTYTMKEDNFSDWIIG